MPSDRKFKLICSKGARSTPSTVRQRVWGTVLLLPCRMRPKLFCSRWAS